jgi:hypothetical protein
MATQLEGVILGNGPALREIVRRRFDVCHRLEASPPGTVLREGRLLHAA